MAKMKNNGAAPFGIRLRRGHKKQNWTLYIPGPSGSCFHPVLLQTHVRRDHCL